MKFYGSSLYLTMYLEPSSKHIIPVHPSSIDGWETLKLSVDQHEFPGKNSNRKVAYLFSHAMGFHKEVLHPVMRRFKDHLRSLREYDQTDITFISWDERNHGDSSRLNKDNIFEQYRISDNAMDTKQVIDVFELNTAKYDQFIGIAHSVGGCSMLLCEYYYPQTFDGLCLMEPVVSSKMHDGSYRSQFPVMATQKRCDEWNSLEECRESILSKDLFKFFDPEVLDLYLKYGIYETNEGTLKIKCPKQQEYIIFKYSIYDIFVARKSLQVITIPVQVVLAKKSIFIIPDLTGSIIDNDCSMLEMDIIEGTHMVPNEKPDAMIPCIMKLVNRVNKEQKAMKCKI